MENHKENTSVNYEKGSVVGKKLSKFLNKAGEKAKEYTKSGVEATKKGYKNAKKYTEEKIHNQKKKIALEVIDDTKDKVENKEKIHLNAAEELVSEEYEKGGAIKTSNSGSSQYTSNRQDFRGNNLDGKTLDNGVYVVLSYGHYPIYVWKKNKWYGNKSKYSVSTAKQMSQSRPSGDIEYVDTDKLKEIATSYFEEGGSIYECGGEMEGSMEHGGKMRYKEFKEGIEVKVDEAYLKDEASHGNATPTATVMSEPSDSEALVEVIYKNGIIDYIPQDWIEPIRSEMEHGGIANQYEGKTPEQVWGEWTKEQREHFLYDHFQDIKEKTGDDIIIDEYNTLSYNDLSQSIKEIFDNHISMGSYNEGGEAYSKGGEVGNNLWKFLNEKKSFWELFE